VGDIHGQYYDMCKMFSITGHPSQHHYLFLGDYVDRGFWGCEVGMYLFACKIRFPATFFMLRGNHETRQLTKYFGFEEECLSKYDQIVYEGFVSRFRHFRLQLWWAMRSSVSTQGCLPMSPISQPLIATTIDSWMTSHLAVL